jgi:two-component system LytT family sensor kinase
MYLLLELVILIMMRGPGPHSMPTLSNFLGAMFLSEFASIFLVPALTGFFFSYTLLFNRFLARKKILALILFFMLIAIAGAAFTEVILYLRFPSQDGRGIQWSFETCIGLGLFLCFILIVHGVLGLVMKGFVKWYGDIRLKEELARRNQEMELALIKSQINPHFLFNTLNNIDMLILKDPPTASEYLNKLSEIMRFMLYEIKTEKVAFSKELDYIEKYIQLQMIRTSNPKFVNYSVKGRADGLLVEPMLFIPFIENAFKHSENKKTDHAIRVSFEIEKHTITFDCENQYPEKKQTRPDYGGLGNELISKRLALLYPGRHCLEITDENQVFRVKLNMNIA